MQIEFDRSMDDVVAFNLYALEHSAFSRREVLTQRVLVSVLAAAIGGGFNFMAPHLFNWVVLGAAAVSGLVVFLVFPWFMRRSTVGRLRGLLAEGSYENMLGHQSLSIAPGGIFVRNKTGESTVLWSAVRQVSEGEKHLFLFITSFTAIVIPKRCFKSGEDQHSFLQLVDTYRRAA